MRMNDKIDLSRRDRWVWENSWGPSFGWYYESESGSPIYQVFEWKDFGYEPPLWLVLKKEREINGESVDQETHLSTRSRGSFSHDECIVSLG